MRKIFLLLLWCLPAFDIYSQANINAPWIWVNGEKHIPMRPVMGIKNVSAPANNPGGRKQPVCWQDQNGIIWMFGGYGYGGNNLGYLNDFWKYDPTTNEWTWVSGDNSINSFGVYGTQGVPSDANSPGARRGSIGWTDNSGNLYLFGGDGYGAAAAGRLNDLWKYNTVTGQWTWLGGTNDVNSAGVFGSQGVASPANWPCSRNGGTVWKDNNNNIWLFGGDGYPSSTVLGRLNDMWKYDPSTNQWTWMKGSSNVNAATDANGPGGRNSGNMGGKDNAGNLYLFGGASGQIDGPGGHFNTNVHPPLYNELWKYNTATNSWTLLTPPASPVAREHGVTWVDSNGDFWLFSGQGRVGGSDIELNDLWKYDASLNQWAELKGDVSTVNVDGVYGTMGVPAAGNNQGGRSSGIGWIDGAGKMWMFGGAYHEIINGTLRNDIWQYDPATNLQTWVKGDSAGTVKTIYGVQGVAAPLNRPGERRSSGSWYDNNGNIWLLGGYTDRAADGNSFDYRDDLWKYNIALSQWTWMKGTQSVLSSGVYGVRGVPDPNNRPGARANAATWTDGADNLWLFGGITYSYYDDVWKYDPSSNQWTWMNGNNGTTTSPGVYGTQGVPGPGNTPGGRKAATNWKDNAGNFWIFGGQGNAHQFNDLWKYDVTSNQWTWVSGDNAPDQTGSYGVIGVASPTNKPGVRDGCASWKDNAGNLWLFGGSSGSSYFNDLWKFDMASNQWTWMSGDNTFNSPGVYGIKGVPNPVNKPSARCHPVSWTDANGNFWLMAGHRDGSPLNDINDLNDLWTYNPSTNQWTWVKGDEDFNHTGIYGAKGIGNSLNNPGSRGHAVSCKDAVGDVWVYGGYGFAESGQGRLADLWKISSSLLSPLPVHFVEFKGRLVNDDGVLNWKTENEENAGSFAVERSTDRRNYSAVGTINANNRSGTQQYNFTDPGIASLGAPVIYYRLKQTDNDGKSIYSNIVALTIDKSFMVFFYPNPVIKTANVTITVDKPQTIQVKIVNQGGAVIKQLQWKLSSGSISQTLDLGALPGGSYYLDLSGEMISKRISFVKQ